VTLVFLPDEDGERLEMHRVEQQGRGRHTERLYVPVNQSQRHDVTLEFGATYRSLGAALLDDAAAGAGRAP